MGVDRELLELLRKWSDGKHPAEIVAQLLNVTFGFILHQEPQNRLVLNNLVNKIVDNYNQNLILQDTPTDGRPN